RRRRRGPSVTGSRSSETARGRHRRRRRRRDFVDAPAISAVRAPLPERQQGTSPPSSPGRGVARPAMPETPPVIPHAVPFALPPHLEQRVSDPLVSVIVTSFNYGAVIADCLRSVQAQTYDRLECIVVDDCSTDNTPAVVTTLLDELNDRRLRYYRLPRNVGQLGAQVEGLRESKGEFVVFLDADDLLFPRFIERHLFVHHNIETAVGFTSSNQWTISRDGQVLSKQHTDLVSRVYLTQGIDLEVKDADSLLAPVRGVLFPFWHDKNDPPTWVWGTQSTMMFRRPLLAVILPTSPLEAQDFRTCS